MEDDKNFTVVLPLIWVNASESRRAASIQTESA